ncbi:MAG: NAD(P)/FAD-dependent oxidoreductase [Candidatus Pseudobacter hemicellulosilyticus]|uniref:Tryptophan 2-monooxygenase n=1 Tax=Candidatus Pseudobacter hemicellulosilyticus TaxID=3121375 RepID=A0AAJ5WSW4_9BACT|nr:MAG: NAD(P)/FAD-dependent oxidoreductase [Pseudobacter sp.]
MDPFIRTTNNELLIIGGGAAGLMAAYHLLKAGKTVTLLEAADRAGGRIHTVRQQGYALPVELGPEFVHGNLPLTSGLLEKAGLHKLPIEGNFYRVENGRWLPMEEIVDGWDQLLQEMAGLAQDMPLQDFLDQYYAAPEQARLRKEIEYYAQGFDVADLARVSVKGLWKEWTAEENDNRKIREGYGRMIDYLLSECRSMGLQLHTGCIVKELHWEAGKVQASTADGRQFVAAKAIVTVSLGVLQSEAGIAAIRFSPALDSWRKAATGLGFGNVIKFQLFFKQAFWQEEQADAAFAISWEAIPTWWTSSPFRDAMLTGYIGGGLADQLSGRDKPALLALALQSLSGIFGKSLDELKALLVDARITDWRQEPLTLGAYSYPTVGAGDCIAQLKTPVADTVYFAGEAVYEGGHPGTVEAALTSGQQVVERILRQ